MSLILAIEPDKRQAAHLTAIARQRLKTEIVLGESAERALALLGDRIPDLILTTALLSPKDEGAIADRLRELDTRAAHVQTLAVPVLATPQRPSAVRGRGVLSALRREKPGASADGCDPAVFAEQIEAYLERAAAERKEHVAKGHAPAAAVVDEPPLHAPHASELAGFVEDERPRASGELSIFKAAEPALVVPLEFAAEPPAAAAFVLPAALVLAEADAEPRDAHPLPVSDAAQDIAIAAASEHRIAGAVERNEEQMDVAPLLVAETRDDAIAAAEQPAPAAPNGGDHLIFGANAAASIMAAVAAVERASTSEPELEGEPERWVPLRFGALPSRTTAQKPAAQPAAPDAQQSKEPAVTTIAAAAPESAVSAAPAPAPEPIAPAPAAAVEVAPIAAEPRVPRKRQSRRKSVQDEWGFFDPAQCGFAALLAKLDEITEKDDAKSA